MLILGSGINRRSRMVHSSANEWVRYEEFMLFGRFQLSRGFQLSKRPQLPRLSRGSWFLRGWPGGVIGPLSFLLVLVAYSSNLCISPHQTAAFLSAEWRKWADACHFCDLWTMLKCWFRNSALVKLIMNEDASSIHIWEVLPSCRITIFRKEGTDSSLHAIYLPVDWLT